MKSNMIEQFTFENQLVAMATDPEVRAELQMIAQEFTVTEANRLERK